MKKNKFILTEENIYRVVNIELRKHPEIRLEVEKSPYKTHNSYYLRFYKEDVSTSLRVSDHDTRLTAEGGGIRNIVVDEYTTDALVMDRIRNCLVALDHKYVIQTLNRLYKEIKQPQGEN